MAFHSIKYAPSLLRRMKEFFRPVPAQTWSDEGAHHLALLRVADLNGKSCARTFGRVTQPRRELVDKLFMRWKWQLSQLPQFGPLSHKVNFSPLTIGHRSIH
jgi:hypothetical protein